MQEMKYEMAVWDAAKARRRFVLGWIAGLVALVMMGLWMLPHAKAQASAKPAAAAVEKPTTAAAATNPPVLSDTVKMRYFKAQSELQQASMQAQQAAQAAQLKQVAMQAAVKAVTDACGKDFQPSIGPDGDPACVPVPPKTDKAAKK
jgi:hypothetical protein